MEVEDMGKTLDCEWKREEGDQEKQGLPISAEGLSVGDNVNHLYFAGWWHFLSATERWKNGKNHSENERHV